MISITSGSISQFPVRPLLDAVVILKSFKKITWPADVSMKPPSPPFGALASKVPPSSILSLVPPLRIIFPFGPVLKLWASITPVFLMTVRLSALAAWAVSKIVPPSERIAPPFSMRASMMPTSTWSLTTPPRSSVTLLPAPRATVPPWALILPSFEIFAAIITTSPPLPSFPAMMLPWLIIPFELLPSNL